MLVAASGTYKDQPQTLNLKSKTSATDQAALELAALRRAQQEAVAEVATVFLK